MQRICVFCGSSAGQNPAYLEHARELGRGLAQRRIELVYGGGRVGLMGAVADAALEAGGTVIGVIPEALVARELEHPGLTRSHVVPDMHSRKALMGELASAFVALPGGVGTLEELFEVVTWAQLGLHHKPIAVLDIKGFFSPLLGWLAQVAAEGFIPQYPQAWVESFPNPEALLTAWEASGSMRSGGAQDRKP